MDETQPTEPLPPEAAHAAPTVTHEPFYKRHGLAFAISTLVLGVVVLIGIVGAGTVVAVNIVSHSVSAFTRDLPRDLRGQGEGYGNGGPGQDERGHGGQGESGQGTQREVVRGTLESASGADWTVKTASGRTIAVKTTSSTAYGLPNQSARASDFAVGDEVVVVGSDRSSGSITATRIVKLSDFPRPPSTPGSTPGAPQL